MFSFAAIFGASEIAHLAIGDGLAALEQWGAQTNWSEVKNDFGRKLKALIHPTLLEEGVETIADGIFDAIALAAKDGKDLQTVFNQLEAGNYPGAAEALLLIAQKAAPAMLPKFLASQPAPSKVAATAPGAPAATASTPSPATPAAPSEAVAEEAPPHEDDAA